MRENILFNDGWRFRRGVLPVPKVNTKAQSYEGIKTGELYPVFADEKNLRDFVPVRLPHDYVIGDTPDKSKNEALGFLEGDEGWYYKRFSLDEADENKCLYVYFEGIATESEIFLNGTRLKRNFSAYNPIYIDITDFVRFDKVNILAVHVKAPEQPEGWWYQGGGIYRDVHLIKTEKVAVAPFGIYVKTQRNDNGTWEAAVETTIKNEDMTDAEVSVRHTISSTDGTPVTVLGAHIFVSHKDTACVTYTTQLENVLLWDTDSPNLYTVKTELSVNGEAVDEYTTRFGFRTIRFDKDKGFFLNGRHTVIKGFCAHQDYGLTGIYLPKPAARYRMELMRRMGANAYRSAHNLSDEYTLDVCDEIGMLVYDETRYFASHEEGKAYIKDMLLRDRNHPCVITWSVGNEEFNIHLETGRRVCESLREFIRKYDDRPVTMAMNEAGGAKNNIVGGELDVIGFNYDLAEHDMLHARFPDKPFVITESCALQTSRGRYMGDDSVRALFDARDHSNRAAWNPDTMSETWKHVMDRAYIGGMFIWAGIEHRGETIWPRLCSQSGMVDLFLQPKEAYYHLMSLYRDDPVVHICPSHWNFAGLEGQTVSTEVYTNVHTVELFLNGVSLGRQNYENYEPCRYDVPYAPGMLTAVGYDENGNELCRDIVETAGKAASLALICENEEDVKNGADLAIFTCVCLDGNGRPVPDAAPTVRFSVSGGMLLGTGSSVLDHVPPYCAERKMYAGRIAVAVRMADSDKTVRLTAESDGLRTAAGRIER